MTSCSSSSPSSSPSTTTDTTKTKKSNSNNESNKSITTSAPLSVRDLLRWNPFRQRQQQHDDDDDDDITDDTSTITYDHHWIIVNNGSYKGYFDWIPIHLRVGKWSTVAIFYFRTLWLVAILLLLHDVVYNYDATSTYGTNHQIDCSVSTFDNNNNNNNIASSVTESCDPQQQQQQQQLLLLSSSSSSSTLTYFLHSIVRRYWKENATTILQLSPITVHSSSFYYNTTIGIYMLYICYSILRHSPLQWGAWVTYTVQSWTILLLRHLLYTLSALLDNNNNTNNNSNNNNCIVIAELLRFPCAVAHTVTFLVWNFMIVPYLLLVVFRNNPQKRRDFIKFCTSFRLVNLHGMNIVFCIANVWYFNSNTTTTTSTTTTLLLSPILPPRHRTLEMADLYLAGISAFFYFTFYLCLLDRIGVHLYPIFSPRHSNIIILVCWTSVIVLYIVTFHIWQSIIAIQP